MKENKEENRNIIGINDHAKPLAPKGKKKKGTTQ